MNAAFKLTPTYKAAPLVGGSLQDTSSLTLVSGAAPYLVEANYLPSVGYVYDALGRLSEVHFKTGNSIIYSYDAAGNRSSVLTS